MEGLDGMPEWPALRALLPELRGRAVVDLGCGFGWFARWARREHAARVLAIDVSERMLERARATTDDSGIEYMRADLERLRLTAASFDLAHSALALHYLTDLAALLDTVHGALVTGGRFVFSVEHPIYTAPADPRWSTNADGGKSWPIDGYLAEGPRSTDWLTKGVIKQHRTVATYLNALARAGFALDRIEEWGPTDAQIAARPALADERQRPAFLLVAARR